MGFGKQCKCFPVPGAKRFRFSVEFSGEGLTEIDRIKRFIAYLAAHEVQCYNRIPLIFQKKLKFNRLLRANPPAVAAPGTAGHIVKKHTLIVDIL
jgi:hypothetical protein